MDTSLKGLQDRDRREPTEGMVYDDENGIRCSGHSHLIHITAFGSGTPRPRPCPLVRCLWLSHRSLEFSPFGGRRD